MSRAKPYSCRRHFGSLVRHTTRVALYACVLSIQFPGDLFGAGQSMTVDADSIDKIDTGSLLSGRLDRSNDRAVFREAASGADIQLDTRREIHQAVPIEFDQPAGIRDIPNDALVARAVKDGDVIRLDDLEAAVGHKWSSEVADQLKNRDSAARISEALQVFSERFVSNQIAESGISGTVDLAAERISAAKVSDTLNQEMYRIISKSSPEASDIDDLNALFDYSEYAEAELFANYGVPTVLDQDSVRKFYDLTFSVCRIQHRLDARMGTGFLVSSNVILTAKHVIEGLDAKDFVAYFPSRVESDEDDDVEIPIDGVLLDSAASAITNYVGLSGRPTRLDFAFIELDSSAAGRLANYPRWRLRVSNLRQEPVYVLGYQGHDAESRKLRVSDDCKVFFPYEVSQSGFQSLVVSVGRELWPKCASGQDLQAAREQIADLQLAFRRSYGFDPAHQESSYFYLSSIKKKDGYPTIGIQSDTSPGFSGGPVCGKTDMGVYGIFLAGYDRDADEATWAQHERVMPIAEVIRAAQLIDQDFFAKHQIKHQ